MHKHAAHYISLEVEDDVRFMKEFSHSCTHIDLELK